MIHLTRKTSTSQAQEMAPTVAVNERGQIAESPANSRGSITLTSRQEYNNRGAFDREMKVHYEPEGLLNRIQYSIAMAGEMAAVGGTLQVSAQKKEGDARELSLHFPRPENTTVPVGEKNVMVEHPQAFYGGHEGGVRVVVDLKKNEMVWGSASQPVTIDLATFPCLLRAITNALSPGSTVV